MEWLTLNYLLGITVAVLICVKWSELVDGMSRSTRRHTAAMGLLGLILGLVGILLFFAYAFLRETLDSSPGHCGCVKGCEDTNAKE